MSTNVKGIAELELKADRFKRPAQEVKKEFGSLEQKGKQSMQGMAQSAEKTKSTFTQFSVEGKRSFDQVSQGADRSKGAITAMGSSATPALNNMSASMTRLGAETRRTAAEINASKAATIGLVTSIASVGTSFVALETTFTNIPKRLKAIAQAEVGLERAQNLRTTKLLALEKVELRINKFREKGMGQSAELQIALKDQARLTAELGTAEADLAVKTEDLNLKHADYADTLKLMASSIFTTFLTAGTSVIIMLNGMASQMDITTGALIRNKLATIANSRALQFLKIDLVNARANFLGYSSAAAMSSKAGIVAATGIKRVGLAFKGLFTAMGPIGWAILGITAIWEAWNSNLFGFRNVMHDVTQFLAEVFKPVLETLVGIVSFFTGETKELTEAWADFESFVFPPLKPELQEAEAATEELTADVEALTEAANADMLALEGMAAGIAHIGTASAGMGSDIGAVANSIMTLTTVQNEFWTKQVAEFDKNNALLEGYLHTATGGFEDQLDHFQRAMIMNMRELEKQAGDLTDAFGRKAVDQWVKDWEPWIQLQIELFGPEATKAKIDSFNEIDAGHRQMIKNMVDENKKLVVSNAEVVQSFDEVKKKRADVDRGLIEDAETIEEFMDAVMQKTNEARNEVLGLADRNIWGNDLLKQATAAGVTDFGSSSAFADSAAFQAENLRRIAQINNNRNSRRNRSFSRGMSALSRSTGHRVSSSGGRISKSSHGRSRSHAIRRNRSRAKTRAINLLFGGKQTPAGDLIPGSGLHVVRMGKSNPIPLFSNEENPFLYQLGNYLSRMSRNPNYRGGGPNRGGWNPTAMAMRGIRAYGESERFQEHLEAIENMEEFMPIMGLDITRFDRPRKPNRLIHYVPNAANNYYTSVYRRRVEQQMGEIDELVDFRKEVIEKAELSIDQQYNIDINPLRQRQELHNRLMYEDRILLEAVST